MELSSRHEKDKVVLGRDLAKRAPSEAALVSFLEALSSVGGETGRKQGTRGSGVEINPSQTDPGRGRLQELLPHSSVGPKMWIFWGWFIPQEHNLGPPRVGAAFLSFFLCC